MSAPAEAFVRCGWLTDPVAVSAGPSVTAIVLTLAARAVERGDELLSPTEWVYHVDPREAAAAVRAGLVTVERGPSGVDVMRPTGWTLSQVDTEQRRTRRLQARFRMRRMRARRRGDDVDQLDFFDALDAADEGETAPSSTCENRAAELSSRNDLACAKAVRANVDVTHDVTQTVEKSAPLSVHPRAGSRAGTSSVPYEKQIRSLARSDEKQWKVTGADFRLLQAVVAAARRDDPDRRRLSRSERRRLLDDVRTTCARAHLRIPPDGVIRRAIVLDGRTA